jgi:hypothetical protein
MDIERRFLSVDGPERSDLLRVERRTMADGTEQAFVIGYAARYGVDSLEGAVAGCIERIERGAFSDDGVFDAEVVGMCKGLWNHNSNFPLASYPDSLTLFDNEVGFGFQFPVSRASYAQDMVTNIEDGIVKGNSFSIIFDKAPGSVVHRVDERGRVIRSVKKAKLVLDVGPCTYPAYGEGALELVKRSFDEVRRERARVTIDLGRFRTHADALSKFVKGK